MSSIFAPKSIPALADRVGATASVSWSSKHHTVLATFTRAPKGVAVAWKLPATRTYTDGASIRGSAASTHVDVLVGAADGKWMVRFSAEYAQPKTITGEGELADALAAAAASAADYARSVPELPLFDRNAKLTSLVGVAL